jgi:hypothetical protein
MAISGTYADGDAIQGNDCEVEVDLTPDSSSFANIDSWTTSVSINDLTVSTTEEYTFTHTGPIVFSGNPGPREVTVTCVYTEGATDPWTNINSHSIGTDMDIRWSIGGGSSGDLQYTTSGGLLTNVSPPQPVADGSTSLKFSFTVKASSVSTGTIA